MGLLCRLSAAMHLEHLAQSLPNTEPLIHDRKNKTNRSIGMWKLWPWHKPHHCQRDSHSVNCASEASSNLCRQAGSQTEAPVKN